MSSPEDNFWSFITGAGVVIPLEVALVILFWVPYHLIREYRDRRRR
jgi:hypothetical protein